MDRKKQAKLLTLILSIILVAGIAGGIYLTTRPSSDGEQAASLDGTSEADESAVL